MIAPFIFILLRFLAVSQQEDASPPPQDAT